MRFKMITLAAAVSIALPAVAQTADQTVPAPKKEKKICRRLAQTGSYLGSPAICHTKAEWAQIDEANGRKASQTLDNSRRPGGMGNGQF